MYSGMKEYVRSRAAVSARKTADGVFYYMDLGREGHGRVSVRVWVSSRLVQEEDGKKFVEFPVAGRLHKTARGNVVLRPDDGYVTHHVFIPCGYRGRGRVELGDVVEEIRYYVYESPRGSLGVSEGALATISTGAPMKVRWERTGRLYGASPTGTFVIRPNGEVVEVVDDEELVELLD